MFTGKDRECVFSDLHSWMCDEDHSIWFSGPPWGIPAQWMELARFYNSGNRVSINLHIMNSKYIQLHRPFVQWLPNDRLSNTNLVIIGWLFINSSNDKATIKWKHFKVVYLNFYKFCLKVISYIAECYLVLYISFYQSLTHRHK